MSAEVEKELPKGWFFCSINEMFSNDGLFVDGDWVESKDQDENGDVRLTQLADVGDGVWKNRSNRFMTSKKVTDLDCTILLKNDVLIARMPDPLGRACIFNGDAKPCVTVVDVAIVRTGINGVTPKWLMFIINSPQIRSKILSLQSGTTRKRISRKNLSKITFPLPPLNEQKRIVEKIEELFSLVDSAKKTLEKTQVLLKQYRQSILKQIFHSKSQQYNLKEIEMNKIFTNRHGDFLPKTKIKQGSYPVFGGNGVVGFHNENNVDGDVIIVGRVGAQCGNIHFNSGQCWITDNTIGLIPKTEINIKFFFYQFKNLELKNISAGSGQPYISGKRLSELNILLTDINEQNKIVEKIEESFSLIEKNEILIDKLLLQYKQIKNSILKQAFEGKLVPQDPNDEPAEVLLQRIREEKNGK